MSSLSAEHQVFIDSSVVIADKAKEDVIKQLTSSFKIMDVLEDRRIAYDLVKQMTSLVEEKYIPDAVMIGIEFGNEKVKDFNGKKNTTS